MMKRKRFSEARSFALYYGEGHAKELMTYDIAIVEALGQQQVDLLTMKQNGTLMLAYVSVMELAKGDAWETILTRNDYLLDSDGCKLRNKKYDTDIMDVTSVRWRSLLLHRIGTLIVKDGYEGIFLDTIGDVEWEGLTAIQAETQLQAAVELVKHIRSVHPDAVIIQNNGLNRLCEETSLWVDGICWENPNFTDPSARDWNEAKVIQLAELARCHSIRILLLLEMEDNGFNEKMKRAEHVALKNDFLIFGSSQGYVTGVRPNLK